MKFSTMAALGLLAAAVAMSGCSKRDEGMGPAQKAGQAVDNAGDKVAQELHDKLDKAHAVARQAADSAQQTKDQIAAATGDAAADAAKGLDAATEKVGQKVEQAGEKIQEAAKR
ncbi:MAG: hypothetical protein ACJ8HI_21435 [Massilia sp.]